MKQKTGTSWLRWTLFALILLMSLFLGLFVYRVQQNSASLDTRVLHGTYIPPGRGLGSFNLKMTTGHSFQPSRLLGHWSLLFFGYTQCHSICPVTMANLHQMSQLIRQTQHLAISPQVYMISLDPKRDSLHSLSQYVHGFDKDFIGVLGDEAQIRQLSRELGVVYDAQIRADGQIDHSGTVAVLNPVGEVVLFFTPPLNPQWMAQDLLALMQYYPHYLY